MRISDTVAAISTPRGKGGIAVIRISGEGTAALAEKIFKSKQSPVATPRRAVLGKICRPNGEVVDEGVAVGEGDGVEGDAVTGDAVGGVVCRS